MMSNLLRSDEVTLDEISAIYPKRKNPKGKVSEILYIYYFNTSIILVFNTIYNIILRCI